MSLETDSVTQLNGWSPGFWTLFWCSLLLRGTFQASLLPALRGSPLSLLAPSSKQLRQRFPGLGPPHWERCPAPLPLAGVFFLVSSESPPLSIYVTCLVACHSLLSSQPGCLLPAGSPFCLRSLSSCGNLLHILSLQGPFPS